MRDAEQAASRKATLHRRHLLEAQKIKFQEESLALAKAKEERLFDKKVIRGKEQTLEEARKDGGQHQQGDPDPEIHLQNIIKKYLPGYAII